MQPTSDFDASRLARSLLRRSRQGALATLMAGSGDPYCSLVNVAANPDAVWDVVVDITRISEPDWSKIS